MSAFKCPMMLLEIITGDVPMVPKFVPCVLKVGGFFVPRLVPLD